MPRKQSHGNGYRLIIRYLGITSILVGVALLLPLLLLPVYPQEAEYAKCFLVPGIPAVIAGYLVYRPLKEEAWGRLKKNQAAMIVTLSWALAILVSAVPFMMTGNYNFTQSVFECTSGYSTTGLSVVNVEEAPRLFLMFRSIMLFVGGVGLVLVVMSVITDYYGMRLFEAEGHDQMAPNLGKSARVIISIYSGYIIGGTILYMIFGMNWFDALNHSIAAVSTGGFSTKAASIGYYQNLGIEIVTIVLMLLGSTGFLVHLALVKGEFKKVVSHCEFRFQLVVYPAAIAAAAVLMLRQFAVSVPESIRSAVFQAVSAMTTTGFQTVDSFRAFSPALMLLMTLLMLIGGGAGSTAGGIKQYRVYLVVKEMLWTLQDRLSPGRVIRPRTVNRCGDKVILTEEEKSAVSNYFVLYIFLFMIGTFIFCCYGYSVQDSMFEFSSAISTVGLSAGITGYDAPAGVLWTATAGMFIGRLEVYIVLITVLKMMIDTGKKVQGWKRGIRNRFLK